MTDALLLGFECLILVIWAFTSRWMMEMNRNIAAIRQKLAPEEPEHQPQAVKEL